MKCPVCQSEQEGQSSFCTHCGNHLEWAKASSQAPRQHGHKGGAILLILLLLGGALFAAGELAPLGSGIYDGAQNVFRTVICLYPPLCPNSGYTTTPGTATYDQQIVLIFAQDFSSMGYNVTAVQQADSYGFGPAYLLNGQSDSGYWYQIGVVYDWPVASGNGYISGFHFIWEVFQPNGTTTNPSLSNIPDNVNSNDTVHLSLYFSAGNVVMSAYDYNTRASSSHSYTAGGGSRFVGTSAFSSTRTPTSLMTEWYHPDPNWTTMKAVSYSEYSVAISSARVCISEYVPPNPSSTVYSSCSSQLILGNTAQAYSYRGLNTYTSQYVFQTGPSP